MGFTAGVGLLVSQVAFGSFIFSGQPASYTSLGIGLVLFSNFAACLVIALAGSYHGAIAGLSPALVIGGALFPGDGMLELVPVSLVGGILFFAGFGMLDEGFV